MSKYDFLARCDVCPFGGTKVPSSGDPRKCKYILIGEAPGRNEVVQGEPFVGETGKLLEAFLSREGLELHGDDFYLITNDEATNFRLVRAPVTSPGRESWEEILPHRTDT